MGVGYESKNTEALGETSEVAEVSYSRLYERDRDEARGEGCANNA